MKIVLASLAILVALAGCGGDDDERASTETRTSATTTEAETSSAERPPAESDEKDEDRADGGAASGEEAAAGQAVERFYAALARGEGDEACSLLASDTREKLEKGLSRSPQLKDRGCPEVMELIARNYPPRMKRALEGVRVRSVRVDGDRARATYRLAGLPPTVMPLQREEGGWRVAAVAGSPGR